MNVLGLDHAGATNEGQSFDVRTKRGAFAGLVTENFRSGVVRVYFNSNATRGSARKFASINDALGYIIKRRMKNGWGI